MQVIIVTQLLHHKIILCEVIAALQTFYIMYLAKEYGTVSVSPLILDYYH